MKISAHQEIPSRELATIDQPMLNAYAEASGDPNLIHLDIEAAKKAGLPNVIAHGMFVAGLIAERAVQFIYRECGIQGEIATFQTRFKAMTFVGETVLVGGKVKEVVDNLLTLQLQATNPEGEVKVQATLRFKISQIP